MMLRLALLALLLAVPARAGSLHALDIPSRALGRDLATNVYLPDGYADSALRYSVLYLLHGLGQSRDEWVNGGQITELADRLIAAHQIPPCIIVMPSAGKSWYLDRAEPMETAIIDDLLPGIDATLRTIAARPGRVIAGESMGGYGALRFVLKYPQTFAAAALLSPAIYVPDPPANSGSRQSAAFETDGRFDPRVWESLNYPTLLDGFIARHVSMPLFIGSGSSDELHIEDHATHLYRIWRKHDWPVELRIIAGRHNFEVWRRIAPNALRFVFHHACAPVPGAGEGCLKAGK